MSLSKIASNNRPEVVELISSAQQEIVEMGIDIAAIPQILDRLTDLYPFPIESSVREVVSNGYDATVLLPPAERKPIQISSPTALNPMFIVEDFGIGMSLDTVRKVYAKYGASTKKTDFNQIGAYGLGAKAPLSYCTEFFGETTHNGITTAFKVSRETKGNFTTILSSGPSDKPNGTKITIPSKEADAQRFRNAVQVYQRFGFEVDYLIDGKAPTKADYRLVTNNFVLDEEADLTARIWVRMDNFANSFHQALFNNLEAWQYSLSGWVYAAGPHDRSGSGAGEQPYLVELKPGVVEFSSSRDEITDNVRSQKLNNQVSEYLKSDDALQSLFKIYRGLNDEAAMEIFQKLVVNHSALTATHITFSNNHYNRNGYGRNSWQRNQNQNASARQVARKEFITDGGYDPTEFYFTDLDRVVLGGILLDPQGGAIEALDSDRSQNYHGYVFKNDYMESLTNSITARTEGIYSLAELAAQLKHNQNVSMKFRHNYRDPNPTTKKLVVMTGTPRERIKSSLTWRKTLASLDEYKYAILVYVDDHKEAKKQFAFVEKHAPAMITVKTYDELKTKVKEIRESRATPKDAETIMVNVWSKGVSEQTEAIKATTARYGRAGLDDVSIQELKDSKALLVITGGYDASSALIGAANAGVKITDRPIYHVSDGIPLKVKQLEKFADYEGLIFANDYKAKSKLAEKLIKHRTYNGEILDTEIPNLSEIERYRMVANAISANGVFYRTFAKYLETSELSPELQNIQNKILKLSQVSGRQIHTRSKLTDAQIKIAFPDNSDSVIALISAVTEARKNEYSSLMYQVSQVAFNSYSEYRKDDKPVLDFYFGYIRDKYEALGGQ